MAGLTVTASDINNSIGDISRAVTYHLRRAVNLKRFLDRYTAQNLVDIFGIPLADANLIKSAAGELDTTNTTFQANRTFVDQVAGLGDL
jgi:hypothetical protein